MSFDLERLSSSLLEPRGMPAPLAHRLGKLTTKIRMSTKTAWAPGLNGSTERGLVCLYIYEFSGDYMGYLLLGYGPG